jgi:ribose transport system permease protein
MRLGSKGPAEKVTPQFDEAFAVDLGVTPIKDHNAVADEVGYSVSGNRISFKMIGTSYGLVVVLAALLIGFCLDQPDTFATASNFTTMASAQNVELLLCLGLVFPLSAGSFDLSIAGTMALSATVAAMLINGPHLPLGIIIVITLATGAAVGAFNAVLVVSIGIHAFITTFGMATVLTALALAMAHSQTLTIQTSDLLTFGQKTWFDTPAATFAVVLPLVVIVWYLLEHTIVGRHLNATGAAAETARLAGVAVTRLRFLSFVASGVFAAIAALVLLSQVGSIDASSSASFQLQPYAALFLGTVAIHPGKFNVVGTIVALFVIVAGTTGLELMGLDPWVNLLFEGAALVLGLLAARVLSGSRQSIAGHAGG